MKPNSGKLAMDGGTPVRTTPLPSTYMGASVMGEEEMELLREVVEKGLPFRAYGDGSPHMVNDFEKEARKYFGVKYALGTSTGSGSFYSVMAGIGAGPGDEVIIPSFGWYTDFEAVAVSGALPVFADIDKSLCMGPDDLERKITKQTKAVMVVYFQGGTNNVDRIAEIAKKHNIKFIEDCAQAFGVTYKGRKVGSIGDAGVFSLQINKIVTTGDGGLLITNDARIFERSVRYHDLGFVRPAMLEQLGGKTQEEPFCGLQFRMNEMSGAVALAQLRKLDSLILEKTRRNYKYLKNKVLSECKGMKLRISGDSDGDAGTTFYMDFDTPERGSWFSKAISAEGIRVGPPSGCMNLMRNPMVKAKRMAHPALPPFGPGWPGEKVVYDPDTCPNTDRILASMVGVFIGPKFEQKDIDDIADAIIKAWKEQ